MSGDLESRLDPENDPVENRVESDQVEDLPAYKRPSSDLLAEGDLPDVVKFANPPQINMSRIIEILRQTLPPDDPTLSDLIRALRLFRDYHVHLNDWNELHNQLSDILFNYGQFSREVERLSDSNEDPDPRAIGIHWHPVAQKVAVLLDWASAPRSIFEGEPFARLQDRSVGPAWAVELSNSCDRLDTLLHPEELSRLFTLPREALSSRSQYVDINELYDAGSDFYDVAERWMYLVDRHLRGKSAELLNLSQAVLSSLEDAEWTA